MVDYASSSLLLSNQDLSDTDVYESICDVRFTLAARRLLHSSLEFSDTDVDESIFDVRSTLAARRTRLATTTLEAAQSGHVSQIPVDALTPSIILAWTLRHTALHPGGETGANFKSVSHRCHPILVAFVWNLTKEIVNLPQGCLQGGLRSPLPGAKTTVSMTNSIGNVPQSESFLAMKFTTQHDLYQ